MIRLVGKVAHSPFRLSQLLQKITLKLPDITQLSSHYEFFIEEEEELTESEHSLLKEVLGANSPSPSSSLQQSLWVVPRFGTQSAWGSKAADILHHVGLTKVERIERAIVYTLQTKEPFTPSTLEMIASILHDKMTETIVGNVEDIKFLFVHRAPEKLQEIPLLEKGEIALEVANEKLGLALSIDEIHYLFNAYQQLNRNPTDVELMMFAQANSEHCRHKIFKANWGVDGKLQPKSLFDMIRNTYDHNSKGVLSAYSDNASVVKGYGSERFYCSPQDKIYKFHSQKVHLLMKIETHNHPTAIEPFAGAGTGQGGEIRDEGATGRGAKPKAGLTGFTVSNLHIPTLSQPWEGVPLYPPRIATSLEIMIKDPLGGAAFNNEFGRPNICGYFRSYLQSIENSEGYYARGYHKPVMLAGGMGNIAEEHVNKRPLTDGVCLIVLGGPALKIGLGGGAASSMAAGSSQEELDFASVQRQNPEMERRCQEVIDSCWALGENNPIISIHDVGAGGLANAIPELVNDSGLGAILDLRKIPSAENDMSPLEIWCNESQERYVLAIDEDKLNHFTKIAERERCPFSVLGRATQKPHLQVFDEVFSNKPIDIPQSLLFGNPPKVFKKVSTTSLPSCQISTQNFTLEEIISRVLQCPTVADKTFLITIGDRSVGGLVARDQMVGRWQVPVADCAVTATHYEGKTGEVMSMGERAPIAVTNPPASARMAVAEAVLNILAADIKELSEIRLSCNWMAAANDSQEDYALFAAVYAVGMELCPQWNITIPVGKDSLSMRTTWQEKEQSHHVVSPVTLVVSAFAPVQDITQTLTPELKLTAPSVLLLVDLAAKQKRLGGSIFAQVTNQIGNVTPDVDYPEKMQEFVKVLNQLKKQDWLWAYHDRSDGGLFVTLCEMAFTSGCGLTIDISEYIKTWQNEGVAALFNEELGVIIQIPAEKISDVKKLFATAGIDEVIDVARINDTQQITIQFQNITYFSAARSDLHALWSKTSAALQELRDNPATARQAYQNIINGDDPGLYVSKEVPSTIEAPSINKGVKPRVAILREQGVNGHLEMAAAFTLAGFEAVDVTMSDLLAGDSLKSFKGLAACGGFSYGDVLGAGKGWAKTILYQSRLREEFAAFFARSDTFTLGVCNGCQMLSSLTELIPGAAHWPQFEQNLSEQFEARLNMVEICASPSILFKDMQGWQLPIVVSHGEGRAINVSQQTVISLRYINNKGQTTEAYPANPNGSPQGATGFTTDDGRVTIMMPHPERVIKAWQFSWHPQEWKGNSPWLKLFINARHWLG